MRWLQPRHQTLKGISKRMTRMPWSSLRARSPRAPWEPWNCRQAGGSGGRGRSSAWEEQRRAAARPRRRPPEGCGRVLCRLLRCPRAGPLPLAQPQSGAYLVQAAFAWVPARRKIEVVGARRRQRRHGAAARLLSGRQGGLLRLRVCVLRSSQAEGRGRNSDVAGLSLLKQWDVSPRARRSRRGARGGSGARRG